MALEVFCERFLDDPVLTFVHPTGRGLKTDLEIVRDANAGGGRRHKLSVTHLQHSATAARIAPDGAANPRQWDPDLPPRPSSSGASWDAAMCWPADSAVRSLPSGLPD